MFLKFDITNDCTSSGDETSTQFQLELSPHMRVECMSYSTHYRQYFWYGNQPDQSCFQLNQSWYAEGSGYDQDRF